MYYNRVIPYEFAQIIMVGGSLHWLVDYVKEHNELKQEVSRQRVSTGIWRFPEKVRFTIDAVHTSGHAAVSDILRVITELEPKQIILMHTMSPGAFAGRKTLFWEKTANHSTSEYRAV